VRAETAVDTIIVPLFASDLALDPAGPDIAEFSIDNAVSQVAAVLSALGPERAKTVWETLGFGGYDSVTIPPKRVIFHSNYDIEVDGKIAKNVSEKQYHLLKLFYNSEGFVVSFTRATRKIWGENEVMDEDVIKQMLWRINRRLEATGLGIHVYQKRMKNDFFICLSFVTKS
jgi:DNA-binding response OmpR family regulator